MKHFIDILDHTPDELAYVLERAAALKARRRDGIPDRPLTGRILGLLFEKPSLRTRVSLEAAAVSLGGSALFLSTNGRPPEARESLADQARVLSRYVDAISIRAFSHDVITTFAAWSSVPVINALSDYNHPTQAMADMLTLREHLGTLADRTLAFVGDGNNVARSLAAACAKLEIPFAIASPEGYELSSSFVETLRSDCPGCRITITPDPAQAVREAAAVYTDVWASMGQEDEAEERRKQFAPYQMNAALLAGAPDDALVMHCLPAHRGEEITDDVLESSRSVVLDQAENRMHLNRALLTILVADVN